MVSKSEEKISDFLVIASTTIIFCLISSAKCFAVGDGDDNGDNGDGGNTSALNFITLFLHFSLMLLYR